MAHGVILGQTPNTNNLLPLDGSRAMTGSLNMGNHKITNVANGTNANDAVNFNQLNTSTIQASRISGVLGTSNIPNLAASKITSGTFATARIPNLNASKITSGILPVNRGGTGVSSLDALYNELDTLNYISFSHTQSSAYYQQIVSTTDNLMMPPRKLPYMMTIYGDLVSSTRAHQLAYRANSNSAWQIIYFKCGWKTPLSCRWAWSNTSGGLTLVIEGIEADTISIPNIEYNYNDGTINLPAPLCIYSPDDITTEIRFYYL